MTVHYETVDGIAVITLDRPERRNAVDHATLLELLEIQTDLRARVPADIRVAVITGAEPAFSAGADLNGVEQGQFAADLGSVLRGFTTLPVPVLASIDGPALGAGTQLVIAADLRIATADSIFGVPAARLGIAVDHWTVGRLAAEFTPPVARAMLVAAETYDGARLHALGAVHRLGNLDDAIAWATRLASLAPLSMAVHKLGLETESPGGSQAYATALDDAWASEDAAEGRVAFLEKRPARFRGR